MDLTQIPTEFLWFITGAFTHMALSLFFGYGKVVNFAQDALNQTLKLLILIMEDMAYMREIKYQHMHICFHLPQELERYRQVLYMGTSCQHSYQRNEEKKSPLATYYNIGDNYDFRRR